MEISFDEKFALAPDRTVKFFKDGTRICAAGSTIRR